MSIFTNIPYIEPTLNPNTGSYLGYSNQIGEGDTCLKFSQDGFWLGKNTFNEAKASTFAVDLWGNAYASSLTLTGGTIKYGKTSFSDSTNGGYFISSSGIYAGAASDTNYMKYDIGAATYTLYGMAITAPVLTSLAIGSEVAILGWQNTCIFSATDNDTVAWTSGSITLTNGVTYSISAGNTGNMSALTYVYLDIATSTTVLQVSTTASSAVGSGKILVAVAQNVASPKDAEFQVFGGSGGVNKLITADSIAANTITANEIYANTLTSAQIQAGAIAAASLSIGEGLNLLPNQYADFEQYTDGAAIGSGTVRGTATASTTTCYSGTQSLKMIATSADNYMLLGTSTTDYNIPCEASTKYIVSAYIKGAAGSEQVDTFLKFSDGTYDHAGSTTAQDVTASWARYTWTKTSPAGVTSMLLRVDNDDNGATVYWDKIQVEKANQTATSPEPTAWKSGATVYIDGGSVYAGSTVTAGVGTNVAGLTGQNATGTGAGSTDSDIRIWAGDTFANRATADFNVTQGGLVTATGFSTNLFRGVSTASIGGDGTDGALTITSGTTNLSLNTIYNFSSISITGTAILSTSGQGGTLVLKTSGNFTCTGSGTINLSGKGGLGGQNITLSSPGDMNGNDGADGYLSEIDGGAGVNIHYGRRGQFAGTIITGGGGGANVTTAGASGAVSGGYAGGIGGAAVSAITPTTIPFLAYQGCGGASGVGAITSGGSGDTLTGSFGGNGGAGLYIESNGVFNFTGTFNVSGTNGIAASGVAGTAPKNGCGDSGGGASGHIYVAVSGNNTNTNTGTYTMTAGARGAGIALTGGLTLSLGGAGAAGSRNFDRRW